MTENTIVIGASPTDVWKVLADGWLFPLWVVGACRIRDVGPSWPGEGSRIHHSVGVWPGVIDDHTEVLAVEEGTRFGSGPGRGRSGRRRSSSP